MTDSTRSFLRSLDDELRAKATFAFDDAERVTWNFVPGVYPGVPLSELDLEQKRSVHDLMQTALSAAGYHKTTTIMGLENVLRQLAEEAGRTREISVRDPGRYALAIFGEPDPLGTWGFRLQGHHVSWNFTCVHGHVAATPAFLGANPAEVRTGHLAGLRTMPEEEDLGRAILRSMSEIQRPTALHSTDAPEDVIWGPASLENNLGDPEGLPHSDMIPDQRHLLWQLVEVYLRNLDAPIAESHRARIEAAGRDSIHFLWIGSPERGEGHYYRIHGPTFAIEYDNTQNGANHVHVVWHDLTRDFGADLLRHHHEHDHIEGAEHAPR
ncbi:MAG: DUF3500 domain-containing protein [Planctomycetota bacterium]